MQETSKSQVVARLTVIRKNGLRTIVEVQSDASFYSFYHFFRQVGAKRSTKELIRSSNRNEGSLQEPGLEAIAKKLEMYSSQSNPVVSKKIRIIKKRAYRKLISARADELGLATSKVNLPLQSFSPLPSFSATRLVSARVPS